MKAKTVWKNWWRSGPEISCNSRWGYSDDKHSAVVFGLHADVRWVNVIGVEFYDMSITEDGKIIGDE